MMHPPLLQRPTVIPDSSRPPGISKYACGTSQASSNRIPSFISVMKRRLPPSRATFLMKVGTMLTLSLVAKVSVTQVVEAPGTTSHVDRRSPGFDLYSRDKEQRLGRKLAFEFER